MTLSLRSRLIVGMVAGVTALLTVAVATIYTVQRRQLYGGLDNTLLSSASALSLLVDHGPPGYRFDSDRLERLSTTLNRQNALFQVWSDEPLDMFPPTQDSNSKWNARDKRPPRMHDHQPHDDLLLPYEYFVDQDPPPDAQFPDHGFFPPNQRHGSPHHDTGDDVRRERMARETVIRSPELNNKNLPRLGSSIDRPRFDWITMPDDSRGRAVEMQVRLVPQGPDRRSSRPVTLTTVVAASSALIDEQMSFLATLLVTTALATIFMAAGVAWFVVGRGLRPLDSVAEQIGSMDETDLKQSVAERDVPPEIRPVIHQINQLLGRLDDAFERERTLTADIAHELRTPVSEIRTIAEVTLKRMREPEEYRDALGEIDDTISNLQGLIHKLLALVRLETGQLELETTSTSLADSVVELWTQVPTIATKRGITLDNQCDINAYVLVDPKLLDIILTNVLSNAATYSSANSSILAATKRVGPNYELTVTNDGSHLNESEAARVFERFWRGDSARTGGGMNCGLGLTLVRRAMEAMGGRAGATVTSEGQFTLTLTFPAAEQPG